MSGKILNALLFGMLLTFILDMTIFIGLKSTYLAHFDVKEYFNPFFFDNQNIFIFFGVSLIFATLIYFFGFNKYVATLYIALFLGSFTLFIKPFGVALGEAIFMQKQIPITDINGKTEPYDIIYDGRRYLYLRKNEGSMTLVIDKTTQISR